MARRTWPGSNAARRQRMRMSRAANRRQHHRGDARRRRHNRSESKQQRVNAADFDRNYGNRRNPLYRSKREKLLFGQMYKALKLLSINIKGLVRRAAELMIRAYPTASLSNTRLTHFQEAATLMRGQLQPEERGRTQKIKLAESLARDALTRALGVA